MKSCKKSSLNTVFLNKHHLKEPLKKEVLNWTKAYVQNVNPDYMAVLDFSKEDILVFEKCYDSKLKCIFDPGTLHLYNNVVEDQQENICKIDKELKDFSFLNKIPPRKCVFNLRFNISFDKDKTVTYLRSVIILSSDDKMQPELVLVTLQDFTKITNYLQGTYFEIKCLTKSTALNTAFLNFENKMNSLLHPVIPLTAREKQILDFLIQGQTSQHISDILFIAKTTVDKHRQNLMRKFNVSNVTQLIRSYLHSVG